MRIQWRCIAATLVVAGALFEAKADTTKVPGPIVQLKGTAIVATYATQALCEAAADLAGKADAEATKKAARRFCRVQFDYTYSKPVVVPVPLTWIIAVGEDATFTLTRSATVRYGAAGKYLTKAFPAGPVKCSNATFGSDPIAGSWKTCDVTDGGAISAPLPPPDMTPQPGIPPAVVVPVPPVAAATGIRVSATTEEPAPSDLGAFRNECPPSHMAADDPIVLPGKPGASHLHTFFANNSTNANSTTESLSAGHSTCRGGDANLSAYWIPAMVNALTGKVLLPSSTVNYYKGDYLLPASERLKVQPPPRGLRIVGGESPTQAVLQEDWLTTHFFECRLPSGALVGNRSQSIPSGCPEGADLLMEVQFPPCWDGKNLDSPDHRSHMARLWPAAPPATTKCPASHPVLIPTFSINAHYTMPAGGSKDLKLASDTGVPGASAHGDVWFNWQGGIEVEWTNNCIRALKDCHAHLIGGGRKLD